MNRRQLFGRVAAIAAAVAVAPAAKVEASPHVGRDALIESIGMHVPSPWQMTVTYTDGAVEVVDIETGERVDALIRNARAEGYERGRAIEQAKQESRAIDLTDASVTGVTNGDGTITWDDTAYLQGKIDQAAETGTFVMIDRPMVIGRRDVALTGSLDVHGDAMFDGNLLVCHGDRIVKDI